MAMDEAILWSVSRGMSPPTLRLYAWEPACLSLGRSQSARAVDQENLRSLGYDLVRRPSGGRAILHIDELTYAVYLNKSDPIACGGVLPDYRRLSAALLAGLDDIGISARNDSNVQRCAVSGPVCFEHPSHYEMTVEGRKLIGSAQLRKGAGVLQHGSLPLHGDIARICNVLAFDTELDRDHACARVRRSAATLSAVLNREVEWDDVARALVRGFSRELEVKVQFGALSSDERQQVEKLHLGKYANLEWTFGLPSGGRDRGEKR